MAVLRVLAGIAFVLLSVYVFLLNRRLSRSRFVPSKRATPFPSNEQLLADTANWRDIDVLQGSGVDKPTNKRYVITGACGSFGVWLVQILHRRGERKVYCLDLASPPASIDSLVGVVYIKCDLSDHQQVESAFKTSKPDVVFHVAANIRFWERARFTYKYSKRVNVDGTKNVIEALAQSQETSEKILVYCSSAAVQLPEPMIMRLGRNFRDYAASYLLSDHWDIPDHHRAGHDYAVSKTEADKLVRLANGYNGIRSGVLRPGMTVTSPTDQVFGMIMKEKSSPLVGGDYAQNFINSQDLAIAFLKYEAALRQGLEEVCGQAFLVTGDNELWNWTEQIQTLQLFATRDLKVSPIAPLPIYLVGHVVEIYCHLRYYMLSILSAVIGWETPSPHPRWMEPLRLHHIQPAMWNTLCSDVHIDDSRVRRVLGYSNKFSNAQTLRWIAETAEATNGGSSTLGRPRQAGSRLGPQLDGLTTKKDL